MSSRAHFGAVVESPRAVSASTRTQLLRNKRKFSAESGELTPVPLAVATRSVLPPPPLNDEDAEVLIDDNDDVDVHANDNNDVDDDDSVEQECGVTLGARVKAATLAASKRNAWIPKQKKKHPIV